MRHYTPLDRVIQSIDDCLTTIFADIKTERVNPSQSVTENSLTSEQKRHSAGLMRVNHTGEVCAQALYRGQLVFAQHIETEKFLRSALQEEMDHLSWTAGRLRELSSRPSYLNIFWYTHAYMIGMIAALINDRLSLGFVEETEKQVSRHLQDHLQKLPLSDEKSAAIIKQMREDEEGHEQEAKKFGAAELPFFIKKLMTLQSKIMTTIAYWI